MSEISAASARCANIVGLGLIGGSIALALRNRGWVVHGQDADPEILARAMELGVIDKSGLVRAAEITFVATPVGSVADEVARALEATDGLVTDVGSVKADLCERVTSPRFVGGHPMAGSELDGLDGADPEMFEGAVWVLTPDSDVPDDTFATVASVISGLGAEVVALPPVDHDRLVAVVSHVPHLTAASLMALATDRAEEHASLLRLAAGGFRDMTRIASGRPGIWIDICRANGKAIVDALDEMIASLGAIRRMVVEDDSTALLSLLSASREARVNLPGRVTDPTALAEVRIRIPDRAGAAAEVFTLAAELGVNIANFEVVHSAEGARGVAVVLVERSAVEVFRGGLIARGFRPTVTSLS